MDLAAVERELHAADPAQLESRILALALAQTGATYGALFLWDAAADGLVLAEHVVEGLTVTLPNTVLRREDARPGIAMWVFENDEPHLCRDTRSDPRYTRYLIEVGSMVAAPIRYQRRPIGVITVSARQPRGFGEADLEELDELARASAKFLRRAQLDRRNRERTGRPFLIKGLSPEWLEVERRIEQASPTDAPILIRGESGTGKDLVANAIHFNSRRADKPLVTVNCAAIPETLLESILFGHVKGAFTGASFHKVGEFHKADGGTLFLDEVGELPLLLQAKVLRAVEQGEVQPLGSNRPPEQIDVRLICATNRDLETMAHAAQFRMDLYYRLSVMTMELPPLRAYKDNLEVLAHVFLQQAAERHKKLPPRISSEAMAQLSSYDFPGNVRELKNTIEHAVIMCGDREIDAEDLPRALRRPGETSGAGAKAGKRKRKKTLPELRESWLAPLETQYLADLLAECRGNVARAAERAGVNQVTLYRLLKRRGIRFRREVTAPLLPPRAGDGGGPEKRERR